MKLSCIIAALLMLLAACTCLAEPRAYDNGEFIVITEEQEGREPVTSLTLGKGEIVFIEVQTGDAVSFSTTDAFVVRADSTGALTAAGKGDCRVKVFYTKDSYVELRFTVMAAPSSIKFEKNSLTVEIEKTAQINCAVNSGAAGSIELFSSDESIAIVGENGMLSAVSAGECDIIAQTYNGIEAACHVTVVYPAPAVITAPEALTGYEGEEEGIRAALEGGYHETLSYSSSDESVAAVDENGTVSFISEGRAGITVSASGGDARTVTVNVIKGTEAIFPDTAELSLYTGGTAVMRALCQGGSGSYTLSSGDESILTVSGDTVQALREGSADVIFTAPNGVSASCRVNVTTYPFNMVLSVEDTALVSGENTRAVFPDEAAEHLPALLSSSDESILTVDAEGLVTAVSVGEARILLSAGGVTQSVSVTVSRPADGISFSVQELIMSPGSTYRPEISYKNGGGRVTLTSSNESVISVNGSEITAHGTGSALVTAFTSSGKTAVMTVQVRPAPEYLTCGTELLGMCAGDSVQLDCHAQEGAYCRLTWRSNNSRVCTVQGGLVTAVNEGSAEIEIVSQNGLCLRLPVSVTSGHERLEITGIERLENSSVFTHYLQLEAGASYRLEVECCLTNSFTCPDEAVCGVSDDGEITAVSKGTAKITVTSACGAEAVILLEVI